MKNRVILYILMGVVIVILLSRKMIPEYIQKMALAIMDFEGYYPGSRAFENNNPGNLKNAGQSGVVGTDSQGHAIFANFVDGWNALIKQLKLAFDDKSRVYNSGMSLYQFFSKYAEANQKPYAEYVAAKLGVSPNTTLKEISA